MNRNFNAVMVRSLAFVVVWLAGVLIADHVLHLGADSLRMLFGFATGLLAGMVGEAVGLRMKRRKEIL